MDMEMEKEKSAEGKPGIINRAGENKIIKLGRFLSLLKS